MPTFRPETQAAVRALGITLTVVEVDTVEQFEPAFARSRETVRTG